MNKEIEIERRFLLKKLPSNIENFQKIIVEDIQIKTGEPHPHLRLRRKGNKMVLTKKYPKTQDSRQIMIEETIDLNQVEYDAELDVWLEDLKGLAILEIEFPSEKEANEFVAPDWILHEIKNEEWLAGGLLSGKKYADIQEKLENLGYKPL